MDGNYRTPRRVSALPAAFIQVAVSLILALSARTGFLHVGVFLVAAASAAFALQSMVSSSYLYFVSTFISVCGAFLIGGVFPAAMSAFAVPTGFIMAYMIKKKSTKISVAVVLEIVFSALFALAFVGAYVIDGYELSVAAVTKYFKDIVDILKNALVQNIEADEEVLATFMKMLGVETREAFDAAMTAMFNTFMLILPAILISTMGVIAYLTAACFKLGTRISHCELVLPDPKWETLPSKASAVIYSLAYVLYSASALLSSEMNVFLIVCYSIVIILTPLMLLMGAKRVFNMRNKGLVIVLFVFGSFVMMSLAMMILAFFGVSEVFHRRDKMKAEEKDEEKDDIEF